MSAKEPKNYPAGWKDPATGHFLPGNKAHTLRVPGLPPKRKHLADLIKMRFEEEMEITVNGEALSMKRNEIMADALAQLISTGEVRLPDRMINGKFVNGRVYTYSAPEWTKQLLRVLRYVEPPIQEVAVSGGVEGIVFDNEFTDQVIQPESESDE